jgi:hypothetical protein
MYTERKLLENQKAHLCWEGVSTVRFTYSPSCDELREQSELISVVSVPEGAEN